MMKDRLVASALLAGLGWAALPGCIHEEHSDRSVLETATQPMGLTEKAAGPSSRVQTAREARNLLREANRAESRGEYDTAMAAYQRLQDMPDSARPKGLDQRMADLKKKLDAKDTAKDDPTETVE